MIHIQHYRVGFIVIAATVNDNREITFAWGFTQEQASRKLIDRMI